MIKSSKYHPPGEVWNPSPPVTVSPLFSPLNIPFYDSPIAPTLPCHLQRFPHSPATCPLQSRSGPTVGIYLGTQEWALRCYFPLFLLIISFITSCLHGFYRPLGLL